MTLIVAMPTEHLTVTDRQLSELGAYKAPTLDAASLSLKAMLLNGLTTSNQYGSAGHSWAFMQTVALPSVAACPKFWLSGRFTGIITSDSTTQLMRIHLNGSASADIYFPVSSLVLPATAGFVEIEFDRTGSTLTWTCYFDGILVSSGSFPAAIRNIVATTGCTITAGVATKTYSGNALATRLTSRDANLVLADSVKPNTRLGPVTIKSAPVVVSAVNGFDKTVVEANTILNQALTAVAGTTPLSRPSGQMKTTGANADITFTVASAIPVDRQVAVGVFVGAQRTSDKPASMGMIRTLDGVPGASQPMVDFSVKAADRLFYSDAFQARASMATSDARQLSDVTHKLTLVEA